MKIIWSELALDNLSDIAIYVSDYFGKSVSEKSIRKIVEMVESLRDNPGKGVQDVSLSTKDYTIRHITKNPNVVYYLQEKDAVVVMTIIHMKRSPGYVNRVLKDYVARFIAKNNLH